MKTLFIVGTYPTNNKQNRVLFECVDSIKKSGFDLLVVSHKQLQKEVVDIIDFYIYDKDNSFLPSQFTPHFWTTYGDFLIQIYNGGHTLPICRNMKNGFLLAKARGYDAFVFMESDVVMSEVDMETLKSYLFSIENDGKEMFFFRPEEYRGTNNSYVYETLLFGGKTQFFIENMVLPTNVEEWLSSGMGFTLEQTFYEKLSQYEEKFLIINDHSSNVFLNSKVNVFRYGLFNCEMIYNTICPNEPVLFIINSFVDDTPKYIDIVVDTFGEKIQHTLFKGQYWISSYKIGETNIVDVKVYEDEARDDLYFSESFIIREENLPKFKEKGIIKYK
jgi:hypothetical protein